jgi:hypothetical protein
MPLFCARGKIPILNENDAVSGNQGYTAENVFSDNDALAAIVAAQLGADALCLLTDVEGLYDKPPTEPGARVVSPQALTARVLTKCGFQVIREVFRDDLSSIFRIGQKSSQVDRSCDDLRLVAIISPPASPLTGPGRYGGESRLGVESTRSWRAREWNLELLLLPEVIRSRRP